jgi:hypothetical protein
MSLELLLARGEDGRPVLPQGLDLRTLLGAPLPGRSETSKWLWDVNRNPNELSRQRWGLVAPAGPEGDRLLALIEPLRRERQAAQGDEPVRVYRIPAEGKEKRDGPYAARWKKHVFRSESVPEQALPRYLLLLGDLDQIPLEFQQVLSTDAFVGRLAFPSDEGYAAYVAKVLRWERAPAHEERARLLFHTSRDGTSATDIGHRWLMQPSAAACREQQQRGDFPNAEILELNGEGSASLQQLLDHAAQPEPSVLLTLSHGLRASKKDARALQGALTLPGGRYLTGAELKTNAFLPGGIWFCFACFSAGTPERSAYAHWLRELHEEDLDALSEPLPEGERPFIAALPQAALANPEGPLAVIGHVDLAWSYSFKNQGRRTISPYLGVLKTLAEGGRVGVAMQALLRYLNETSAELTILYNNHYLNGSQRPPAPETWASLWMLHQDLAHFVLLGDPAVRLPLMRPLVAEQASARVSAVSLSVLGLPVSAPPAPYSRWEPASVEEQVLELLAGQRPLEAIAASHSVSPQELRRWADIYRAAGLAALAGEISRKK